jgi:hypothetical protein
MSEIVKTGTLLWRDLEIDIYYDCHTIFNVCWGSRNPESYYTGVCFLENGKITYPEDAVIPIQTVKDREIIPKFIVSSQELKHSGRKIIIDYLEKEYTRRNARRNKL